MHNNDYDLLERFDEGYKAGAQAMYEMLHQSISEVVRSCDYEEFDEWADATEEHENWLFDKLQTLLKGGE